MDSEGEQVVVPRATVRPWTEASRTIPQNLGGYPWERYQAQPVSLGAVKGLRLVVQNTFLEAKEEQPPLRKSCSDSCVSSYSISSGSLLGDDDGTSSRHFSWHSDKSASEPTQCSITPDTASEDTLNPEHGLPSRGSAGHDQGDCKPCCFFRRQKCVKGQECDYCHLPNHETPARPGKQTRERAKLKALKAKARAEAEEQASTQAKHLGSSKCSL